MTDPKKSLGQHWLHDAKTLEAIVKSGDINDQDTVLEIGPGTGTLTRILVKQAAQVIAVEVDENLVNQLNKQLNVKNLKLVNSSILDFDLDSLPADYKIVANIPYYLTSKLIRMLSEAKNPPALVVLLVQKEVAQRIAAKPGDMSLLSVSAQYYFETELGLEVGRNLFTPPPKVDSQVIVLKKRNRPLFEDIDTKAFFTLVKAGFSSRRKTLLNSLAGGLRTDKELLQQVLAGAQILPDLRAQALSLDEWYNIYEQIIKTTRLLN